MRLFSGVMGILAFLLPFSLIFVAGAFLPSEYSVLSSVMILLGGIATLLADIRHSGRARGVIRFALITGALFGVELLGVRTGFPFGSYEYTDRLGLLVTGVPAAIGVAWYCTVVNGWRIVGRLVSTRRPERPLLVALGTGMMTLGLDVALEPMAGFVEKYWVWSGGFVPLQNYLSWFMLSTAAAYLLERTEGRGVERAEADPVPAAAALLASHALLFMATSAANGFMLDVLLSLLLMFVPALLFRSAHSVGNTPDPVKS